MKCPNCGKELEPRLGSELVYGFMDCANCTPNKTTVKKGMSINIPGIILSIIILIFSASIIFLLWDFLTAFNVTFNPDSIERAESFFGASAQVAGTLAGLLIAALVIIIESNKLTLKRIIENALSGKTPGLEVALGLFSIFFLVQATAYSIIYMAELTDSSIELSIVSQHIESVISYFRLAFLYAAWAVTFKFVAAIALIVKELITK